MKYDFRKALTKLSPKEQADKILTKMLETISNRQGTIVPEKAVLEFCLEKESWLSYDAYRVTCDNLAWERLDCENIKEAKTIFNYMLKLLTDDEYSTIIYSEDRFAIML